eukprot:TRINITY_DN24089_c0_g1_i1.p1 TRINITY_DN24089_c0_g1~~TRINITY_DN24089_c0_g1_i1.p1  ORF type:complete len:319 (+),score=51.80 TRINITY_DN24089_c0_g1_i1:57-1013(+)
MVLARKVLKRPSGHSTKAKVTTLTKVKVQRASKSAKGSALATSLEATAHGANWVDCFKVFKILQNIEQTGLSYAESSTVLIVLKPVAAWEEDVFKKLKHGKTIKKLRFHGSVDKPFDLHGFGTLLPTYLPKLETISFDGCEIRRLELKGMDSVRVLEVNGCEFKDNVFEVCLPNLKELLLQCTVPAPVAFAASLLRCPRIERFFAHKFWCSDVPTLYLPSCKDFTFRRGDCVNKLHLYLPRVKYVNLDANYGLLDIKFLKQGHREMKDFDLKPGKAESRCTVSVVNTCAGLKDGLKYLKTHPRVRSLIGLNRQRTKKV